MELQLIGRMQLWSNALADCEACLVLASRLTVSATSDAVRSEENSLRAHHEGVTGRKVDAHISYSDDQSAFASFKRSLLTSTDCHQAAYHLHKLAIVYFMQMYADGDEDPGKVAENKGAVEIARNRLERRAFSENKNLREFRRLTAQLRRIRNKQLGHASGPEFNLSHQPNSVSSVTSAVPDHLLSELRVALQQLMPVLHQNIGDLLQATAPPK